MSKRGPEKTPLLEQYYRIRKSGEFPTSATTAGAIIGGLLLDRACSAVAGEGVGLLSMVPLTLAGGALGYWFDRRYSKRRMQSFLEENPQINELLSQNSPSNNQEGK